jgi:hypothetical protein
MRTGNFIPIPIVDTVDFNAQRQLTQLNELKRKEMPFQTKGEF